MARQIPGLIPKFAQPNPTPAEEATTSPIAAMTPAASASSFSHDQSPLGAMTTETPATSSEADQPPPSQGSRRPALSLRRPKPATDDTPMPNWATAGDEPPADVVPAEPLTRKTATEAALVAVSVFALLGAVAVRMRYRGERGLREPSKDESADIARPLGNILLRRARMTKVMPDVLDALSAISAVGHYANTGPLTYPKTPVNDVPQMEASQ